MLIQNKIKLTQTKLKFYKRNKRLWKIQQILIVKKLIVLIKKILTDRHSYLLSLGINSLIFERIRHMFHLSLFLYDIAIAYM